MKKEKKDIARLLLRLKRMGSRRNVEGMGRFGIRPRVAYGVSLADMRTLAKKMGRNHRQALALWETGVHEARMLAALTADPAEATRAQLETWAADFESWDICDTCCGSFIDKTPWAWSLADEWSRRDAEFVKRAGFALMAWLAVHYKAAPDRQFLPFFRRIREEAGDGRNYVRKAVNWALRQIGKRSPRLGRVALAEARRLRKMDSKSARWIGSDAERELTAKSASSAAHPKSSGSSRR